MTQPRPTPHRARTRALFSGVVGLLALLVQPIEGLAQSSALPGPPPYSAEAHYRAPDGTTSVGKVVKSGSNMRLEYTRAGQPIIQIIRRADGVMYVLDPTQRTWFEVRGAPDPNAGQAGYVPPCDTGAQGATCTLIGHETTSGITAEVWEIGQPGQAASRILWDGIRQRALRQESPDGTVLAMKFVAMEPLAGRRAEHWQISLSVPGQPEAEGQWFYDPELRVELREELPSGEVHSLENIAVGGVSADAFTVPAGWRQIAVPGAGGATPVPAPAPN